MSLPKTGRPKRTMQMSGVKKDEEHDEPDFPAEPPPNATLNVEFDPMFGSNLDFEYDQQYPHQPNLNPLQEQTHDYHHNSINKLAHAPYVMHPPHGDYKVTHPGHPYEGPMEDMVTGHVSLDDDDEKKEKKNITTNQETQPLVSLSNTTTMVTNVTSAMLAPLPTQTDHASMVPVEESKQKNIPEMLHLENTPVIQIEVAQKSGANIENKILANQIVLQNNLLEKSNNTIPTIEKATSRDTTNSSTNDITSTIANVTTNLVNSTWNKGNRSEELLDSNGAKNQSQVISENKMKQELTLSNITSNFDTMNLLTNQSTNTKNFFVNQSLDSVSLMGNQSMAANNLLGNQSNMMMSQPANSSVTYLRTLKFGSASKDAVLSTAEKRDEVKQVQLSSKEDEGKAYRKSHTPIHPKFMQAIQEFTTKMTRFGQRPDSDNWLPAEIII